MPATYYYPEAVELRELGPEMVAAETANDPTFQVMPIETANAAMLEWSVDDDDYGLQGLRGLDGAPTHVTSVGSKSYLASPGYFGEHETVTEKELTERTGSVMGNAVIDVSDIVVRKTLKLVKREVDRIRQIAWALLTAGTFSISAKNGTVTYTDTFALQTYTGSDWTNPATSVPLANLRAVQLLGSTYGTTFNSASKAYMNRVTANRMFGNTNAADFGGKRAPGGSTLSGLPAFNTVLLGEDLPTVVVYDDGYKNDAGTWVKFIPDGKVVVIGVRNDGDRIGEYRMTINLNNANRAPGSYGYVKDYIQGINAPKETPPRIEIHRGHNGGPVIFRPKSIVVMTV